MGAETGPLPLLALLRPDSGVKTESSPKNELGTRMLGSGVEVDGAVTITETLRLLSRLSSSLPS